MICALGAALRTLSYWQILASCPFFLSSRMCLYRHGFSVSYLEFSALINFLFRSHSGWYSWIFLSTLITKNCIFETNLYVQDPSTLRASTPPDFQDTTRALRVSWARAFSRPPGPSCWGGPCWEAEPPVYLCLCCCSPVKQGCKATSSESGDAFPPLWGPVYISMMWWRCCIEAMMMMMMITYIITKEGVIQTTMDLMDLKFLLSCYGLKFQVLLSDIHINYRDVLKG